MPAGAACAHRPALSRNALLAGAGSGSFGICEVFPALVGSALAMDDAFLEAAAQGQTVFFSSGDTGGFCPVGAAVNGVPAGAPNVNYPASSTYSVAVGGTTLLTNPDGTYSDEIAWVAGGGGTSLSSPLALGVWARIESAHGSAIGFGPPALYAARGSLGFHDVVLGDTGPWPAAPGWDFATGLGTFDVAQMSAALSGG
jgi:pseudomonalisin